MTTGDGLMLATYSDNEICSSVQFLMQISPEILDWREKRAMIWINHGHDDGFWQKIEFPKSNDAFVIVFQANAWIDDGIANAVDFEKLGIILVESRWRNYSSSSNNAAVKTITVDQQGYGNFKTVQEAINSIPSNNNQWIRIHVKQGIYREKVIIPMDKPFIVLEGQGRARTIIEWNDHSTLAQSPTFSLLADNFVARYISFKNVYNYEVRCTEFNSGQCLKPAVAAFIQGNKASFYYCGFYGVQDTLWDASGLHYFHSCYIEGAIDFIFGMGQSIYQNCAISVIEGMVYPAGVLGYITAQGREDHKSTNGFVFKNCNVFGNGKAYLGRAWREYSRVFFYKCVLSNVIVPEGWNAWNFLGQEDKITYGEFGCTGTGSDTSKRVKWAKKLSANVVAKFVHTSFIDKDGWLKEQP